MIDHPRHLRRVRRAALSVAIGGAVFFAAGASSAAAHPLGNFSINHLDALTFTPDRIVDDVVVDIAEIPTAQATPTIDRDGDGSLSADELTAYGAEQCKTFANEVTASVDGSPVTFSVTASSFAVVPGQAQLPTGRLECRVEAPADLAVARSVAFTDGFLSHRVGWHEINATGRGTHIVDSPVPTTSITNGLHDYPTDLLSSPLDVRSATFQVQPGDGTTTISKDAATGPTLRNTGLFTNVVDRVQRTFDDLIGRHELTLGVGLLAVALALILGASHAVLPGHGKTVMAAYIAGRQGSMRDAVVVGATVTGAHTGGVLLLGMALTMSTSLAGESVLGWLGITSGLLVACLGLGLLRSAVRHRGSGIFGHGHTHAYGHTPGHGHGHGHSHDGHTHSHHGHDHSHSHAEPAAVLGVRTDRLALTRQAVLVGVGGGPRDEVDVPAYLGSAPARERSDAVAASAAPPAAAQVSRHGLIGMGVAGGLVPSPSALIILLSAIALGRTWFGILLVVAYGLGMAATLTAAGLVLVTMRDRLRRRAIGAGRLTVLAQRWGRVAPYAMAALVLFVGVGLVIRSFGQV